MLRVAAALDHFGRDPATSSLARSVVSNADRSSNRWETEHLLAAPRPPLKVPPSLPPRRGLKDQLATACTSAIGGDYYDRALFDADERPWLVCERTSFALPGFARDEWSMLFLMNDLGYQQAKLSPRETASTPVTLASREYFRKSMDGETACLGVKGSCDVEGVPELVRSVTSGKIVLVVAQRVRTNSAALGVAALETPLREFENLVLPLGMQIAVVNREGRIMAHSNNDAHHGQSIFGEFSGGRRAEGGAGAQLPTTSTALPRPRQPRAHRATAPARFGLVNLVHGPDELGGRRHDRHGPRHAIRVCRALEHHRAAGLLGAHGPEILRLAAR